MALVSSTPSHLSQLGLLDNYTQDDTQQNLNFLMSQALITVSALPFYLAYDQWSWNIFSGDIPMENWNAEFWRLKRKIVGVVPAIKRNNNLNLDGATIFHTIHNFDMIRYFTRTILQFQFFETLCKTSGHTGPLHRCNFSGSKAAGDKLAEMLQLGTSLPWPHVLEKLTGARRMSSQPILTFFEPLHKWLQMENSRNGDVVGWS